MAKMKELTDYQGMTPEQYWSHVYNHKINPDSDQNDAYAATMLQMLLRDEDFQRSSPQQQVERLMAAGMSRSAALGALSEQQFGSVSPQIAGTSEQNKIARINTALNAVNQLVGVVQSGVQIGASIASIQHTLEATRAMQMDNSNTAEYISAQRYVARHLQVFDNYASAGNELPASFSDAVSAVKQSNFASQLSDYDEAMSNAFYYAAMKKAYQNRVLDKTELYNQLRRDNASAELTEYGVLKACEEVEAFTRQNEFDEQSYDDRLNELRERVEALQNENAVTSQDAQYWTENGGENRRQHLETLTAIEQQSLKLARLDVRIKDFDAYQADSMIRELESARALGQDYFEEKVNSMILSETNRKQVLSVTKMVTQRQMNREAFAQGLENSGMRLPAAAIRIYNYFQTHGIVDKVLSRSGEVAASVVMK